MQKVPGFLLEVQMVCELVDLYVITAVCSADSSSHGRCQLSEEQLEVSSQRLGCSGLHLC